MRTSTIVGLAGLVLSASAGAALADWEDAKSAAFAYHDAFDSAYMAFDGEATIAINLGASQAGCHFTYSYTGFGGSIDITAREPQPANGVSENLCNQAQTQARTTAATGISFSGEELHTLLTIFGEDAPTLVDTGDGTETYALMVPASRIPSVSANLPKDTMVTFAVTFATDDGRLEYFTLETTPAAIQPGVLLTVTSKGDLDFLDDGRPYASEIVSDANVQDTTGGNQSFTSAFNHAFSHVSVVTPSAAAKGTNATATGFVGLERKALKGALGKSLLERVAESLSAAAEDAKAHIAKEKGKE